MSKRKGGRIESWFKQEVYASVYPQGSYVIVGFVYGDSEWPDGSQLRTSVVTGQSPEMVTTLNTVYQLGDELCQQDTTTYRKRSEGYLIG